MRQRALVAAAALVTVLLAACGNNPTTSYASTAQAATAAQPAPCASPPPVTRQPAAAADWPVYHRTPDRHGVDSGQPAAQKVTPAWGVQLDGAMFAQPLLVQGLVIEATQHDSVYAFDAATGCQVWRTSLGTSFDVTKHKLQCNNIEPELGITGTPAIDPQTGTVYVAPFLDPGRYEMDALDLATGAIRWRHPIELPDSDVLQQLNRPAIALGNGRAYVSFGGRAGDCGNYHGHVVGVRTDGQGPDVRYQVSPGREGAVWAPGGPVLLPGGDLLITTGNTEAQDTFDGNDAVVRLTPDLQRRDIFAPSNWKQLNRTDLDLGSVGPTLLDGGRLFAVGKEGVGYLLDADHLGGVGGQLFSRALSGGCYAIGATAYRAPLVYVPCDHSLTAVRVSGSGFDVAWRGPDIRSGSPIVAAGLVWDYDFEGGWVWAFDPQTGAVRQKLAVGVGQHFVSVSAKDGRLFVPANRNLYAFALS
ncbi:MAG TPA: PQQ-binding-like beta-propeller repeat protein [Candidatus Dormibacteraeota bacterium]|nr:PQQ-binding-like beta-propeller repeat protein [Candidatus Dormibacteraeota bacterium]